MIVAALSDAKSFSRRVRGNIKRKYFYCRFHVRAMLFFCGLQVLIAALWARSTTRFPCFGGHHLSHSLLYAVNLANDIRKAK
jgi:hypothetical protein